MIHIHVIININTKIYVRDNDCGICLIKYYEYGFAIQPMNHFIYLKTKLKSIKLKISFYKILYGLLMMTRTLIIYSQHRKR